MDFCHDSYIAMTITERPPRLPEDTLEHEKIEREGVVLVIAHKTRDNDIQVCLLRHRQNPFKSIEYGELGLPSETIEVDDQNQPLESPNEALSRLFSEELGITTPTSPNFGLYVTPNCSTGFGGQNIEQARPHGQSVKIMPYGLVMWTANPAAIIRSFQRGYSTKIDSKELAGIGFYSIESILDPASSLLFRTAPHAPTLIREVTEKGLLKHP